MMHLKQRKECTLKLKKNFKKNEKIMQQKQRQLCNIKRENYATKKQENYSQKQRMHLIKAKDKEAPSV